MTARAALGLVLGASAGGVVRAQETTKSFSIPEEAFAQSLYERAERHLAARRFGDALVDFQSLIEEHAGSVLAARELDSRGRRSQQPAHPGAATLARARLFALEPAARKLYRDRHEVVASDALSRALRARSQSGVVEVARRYPLTRSAERAWVALGDLELEAGNLDVARLAWQRASAWAARSQDELRLGALREELSRENGDRSALPDALCVEGAQLELARRAEPFALPGGECHTWRARLDTQSDYPFLGSNPADLFNLFPIVREETVFVSTTLRLLAFQAWSGELAWQTSEPPGWREVDLGKVVLPSDEGNRPRPVTRRDFFEGLDRTQLLVAPAVWGSVVVAALQVPRATLGNTEYQDIDINKILPDRRLFAYDARTGEPLWAHLPPPIWDGESGTFQESMRVAGPPVILGARVFAPMYRVQGRFGFHVACFDLYTGALLWSTAVISGQRELNMFGRHGVEFCAPPLAFDGARVIAVTGLGSIAALDVFTGEIEWETLYDQIPLPASQFYARQQREQVWRNAPPAIASGVIVATPVDSYDLVALDALEGTLLWSRPARRIARGISSSRNPYALLGASADSIFLGGRDVVALRNAFASPTGPNEQVRSDSFDGEFYADSVFMPRPSLAGDHVLVATSVGRRAVRASAPKTLDPDHSAAWQNGQLPGNMAQGHGALFVLAGKQLSGLCDWSRLEDRLTRALRSDPKSTDRAVELARFLIDRAHNETPGRARQRSAALARARETLEPFVARAPQGSDPRLGRALYEILLAETRLLSDQADGVGALARSQRARDFARSPEEWRDLLVLQAGLLRNRDLVRWQAVLDELDLRAGSLPLADRAESALAGQSSPGGPSVGLWVLRERIVFAAERADVATELSALHALLERFQGEPLADGATMPAARIGELFARHGRAILEPYERRAAERLGRARANDDRAELVRIENLFPHSRAAAEAIELGLEGAWNDGDLAQFSARVSAQLGPGWRRQDASEAQARRILQIAELVARGGNGEWAKTIVRALAPRHPDLIWKGPDREGELAQVAGALATEPVPLEASELSTFDQQARVQKAAPGSWVLIGAPPPRRADDAERWLVAAKEDTLVGFHSAHASEPRWTHDLRTGFDAETVRERTRFAPGRVLVALRDGVIALDVDNGEERWSATSGSQELLELAVTHGLLLLVQSADEGFELVALEAENGVEMWRRELPAGLDSQPLCGEGHAVFMPLLGAPRAWVVDLLGGGAREAIELPALPDDDERRSAWVERELLIVPSFASSTRAGAPLVNAWNVGSGRLAWSVPVEGERRLFAVASAEGHAYLVLEPGTSAGRPQAGQVLELDSRLGAVRTVPRAQLQQGDVVLGLQRGTRTELASPYLFVRSGQAGSRELLIRAIQLPYGERWSFRVPLTEEGFYNEPMPLPALSQSTVALVVLEPVRGRNNRVEAQANLWLFDRAGGQKRDVRLLGTSLGALGPRALSTLGGGLFVAGKNSLMVLER